MLVKSFFAILALSLLIYGQQALAEAKDRVGWYAGGSLGYAEVSTESFPEIDVHESSASLSGFGGYNFNPWFGLEGTISYIDRMTSAAALQNNEILSLSFMGKLNLPISSKLDLFFKAGQILVIQGGTSDREYRTRRRSDNDWDDDDDWFDYWYNSDDGYYYSDDSDEWSEFLFAVGIGMNIEVAPHINLRLAIDHYQGTLDNDHRWYSTENRHLDTQVDQGSIGVYYQF